MPKKTSWALSVRESINSRLIFQVMFVRKICAKLWKGLENSVCMGVEKYVNL